MEFSISVTIVSLRSNCWTSSRKVRPRLSWELNICVCACTCVYTCVFLCVCTQCECGDRRTTTDVGPHLCFEKRSLLLFTTVYSGPACLQASSDSDFLVLPLPPSKGKNSIEVATTASTLRSSPHIGIYFLCRGNMLKCHTDTPQLGRSEGSKLKSDAHVKITCFPFLNYLLSSVISVHIEFFIILKIIKKWDFVENP